VVRSPHPEQTNCLRSIGSSALWRVISAAGSALLCCPQIRHHAIKCISLSTMLPRVIGPEGSGGFLTDRAALGSNFARITCRLRLYGDSGKRSRSIVSGSSSARIALSPSVRSGSAMAGNVGMAEPKEESEVERVIVKAIERHARGNAEALARLLVAELRRAGFEIRRASGAMMGKHPA
jgi:hypothetical protein